MKNKNLVILFILLSLTANHTSKAQDTLLMNVDVYMKYDNTKDVNIYLSKKDDKPVSGVVRMYYSPSFKYYCNVKNGYKDGTYTAIYSKKQLKSIGKYSKGYLNGEVKGYELQKDGKWKLVSSQTYDHGSYLKSVEYKKHKTIVTEYNPDIKEYKKSIVSKTIIKKGPAWVEESEYLEDISIIENMTDGIKKSL